MPSLLLDTSLRSLLGGAGKATMERATSMTVQQWEKLLDADRGALIRSWYRLGTALNKSKNVTKKLIKM